MARVNDALVLARLCLAVVFAVAGVAKFLDRPGSRDALVDFGVPDGLAGTLSVVLPVAEIVTAVAMGFASSARWGAILGLVLLAAFVGGLTRALRKGETPDCHCFGQVHSEPASWVTVARNVALAVPAGLVAVGGPGPSLVAWVDGHSAEALWLIATSTLAALATASSAVLWRANRRLRSTQAPSAPRPVRVGARAPRFTLPSFAGQPVKLQDLLTDRPSVLTFVAPACGPCRALLPAIARWQDSLADRLTFPVVSAGDADAAGAIARDHGLAEVLSDVDSAVSRAYGVPGTPCAVLVAPDGSVKSAPAAGQLAIEALVRLALHGEESPRLAAHQVA
jgi:peroxiredoxin